MKLEKDGLSGSRILLPVLHVQNYRQARENIIIARGAGADGVFLISHGSVDALSLMGMYQDLRQTFPNFWIGANFLDLTAGVAFRLNPKQPGDGGLNAIWADDMLIDALGPTEEAAMVLQVRERYPRPPIFFGSVAFKYQDEVSDLGATARMALPYLDVLVTSGPATGEAAELSKIREIREAIGDFPMALASGVTRENVRDYLPYVDYYLVATGISRSFFQFDPNKMYELTQLIHSYQ